MDIIALHWQHTIRRFQHGLLLRSLNEGILRNRHFPIGCSILTPPQGRPVLDDRIQEHYFGSAQYVQFATTPERRIVLMNVRENRACAEPTADSAENLSYNLAAALSAKDTKNDAANASITAALQAASKSLFNRTQGI